MTTKVIKDHKSSSNFSVNPTLHLSEGPLIPPPNCVVSLSLPLSFSKSSPLIALNEIYESFRPCFIGMNLESIDSNKFEILNVVGGHYYSKLEVLLIKFSC